MAQSNLDRELAVAEDLARAAGASILEHYATRFRVDYKDSQGADPVTVADRDANEIIVAGLHRAFPEDGVLAEESADDSNRRDKRRLWCVDPLDGTREFVDRNGQFVVMIGLAVDGLARLGVVFQPTEGLLWRGVVGRGAEEHSPRGTRTLRVSSCDDARSATMVSSRSHRSETVTKVAQALGVERDMPLGSVGLKVARISEGAAELYISVSTSTKEWDACGPDAILAAAGGSLTDIRGRPLRYNKDVPNTPCGMLATNGRFQPRCVAALASVADERGYP